MGVIFGFGIGWVSLASDYNVYQPASTPTWKTFAVTYAGLISCSYSSSGSAGCWGRC
jgi:purine-cytosine permease-like protein